MTTIAIKKVKGGFEMATDTQTSWCHTKMPKIPYNDNQIKSLGKIFEINGITFGCAGSVGDITMLQYYAKTHIPKEIERDSLLDWMIEFKEWLNTKAKVPFNEVDISCIICANKKAFVLHDWLSSHEVDEYAAIGSGMWIAMGAFEMGATAKESVEVAIKHDLYSGYKSVSKVIK